MTVEQTPVPAALSGDALGPLLCTLSVSGGGSASGLTLSISESSPPASAVLFEDLSPNESRLVVASQTVGGAVEGLVSAPGVYGATTLGGPWALQGEAGEDMNASDTPSAVLRNLSGQLMTGSFFDGQHLFVCNGPRLLIYKSLPSSAGVAPDVVLGSPDLNTLDTQVSSSLFGKNECRQPWSDGHRLMVANESRVLIWDTIPVANQTPADLELGQPQFSTDVANNGGVSANSIGLEAVGVASDGTHVAVADRFNERVLYWNTFPTAVGQPADFVIGQSTFTGTGANVGTIPLYEPMGLEFTTAGLFLSGYFSPGVVVVGLPVSENNAPSEFVALPSEGPDGPPYNASVLQGDEIAELPAGGLAVRDSVRVAVLNALPTGPATVSFVLGEPDPLRVVTSPTTASVTATLPPPVSNYTEEHLGRGAIVTVPDSMRLLVYDTAPTYNFEPASRVIGQAGFTTNGQVDYRGITGSTLAGPSDLAVYGTTLAVADRGNNRVLLFSTPTTSQDPPAAVVVGQADARSYIPNVNQTTPSASTLSGPQGVALDGTHLIVADSENHRVLVWNSVPTANGTAADLVLGQTSFSIVRPNHGNGDSNGDGFSDADATGMFYPTGVASDGVHLFVSDRLNNRVLVWSTFPTTNGQAADGVIGQPNFTTVASNAGQGDFTIVPGGLNLPMGIALSGTSLFVADSENNRVVRWDTVTTAPAAGAFLGQPDGATLSNPNYSPAGQQWAGLTVPLLPNPTTAASVLHPRGVNVAGGTLYVSELDSNRVHLFSATTLAASGELGQTSATSGAANSGGVGPGSLSAPWGVADDGTNVWVADSANHRVLGYPRPTLPSSGALAATVLGQTTFLTSGFNQTSTAAGGATLQPHGLAFSGGDLYVADTNNNRVTVFAPPIVAGETPTVVFGQPNGTLALANSGGGVSAQTLSAPQGVFADATHVIVADTGNNRVLVYAPGGGPATLVLGQADFTHGSPAATPTATTMSAPTGVFTDEKSLWVADTSNHRVLVWSTFPTTNGQAADLVLGQSSFGNVLPNQGTSNATASSLVFPSDVLVVNGVLFVADSGNNRLVSFSTPPAASGASADGVLGQASLTGRVAAVAIDDNAHLAGPVKLATDGENVYVADRDLGRVVVYTAGASSGASASQILGPQGGLALQSPQGVAVTRTPYFTSQLFVADVSGNVVDIVGGVNRLQTN